MMNVRILIGLSAVKQSPLSCTVSSLTINIQGRLPPNPPTRVKSKRDCQLCRREESVSDVRRYVASLKHSLLNTVLTRNVILNSKETFLMHPFILENIFQICDTVSGKRFHCCR
jgi:hypothetical protein